ncbi:MAG: hypothetical protein A2W18_10100 [Candidatus Muproteobacteria bacterium RBG_16_60_9]|uniref:Silver efflux pump n=1 Tax=Candidatus Muproteobacteria bacterium RBG_16_60_9 TaxID=1817755 RepID=A0A1F6VGY7_9PROT|nr:MAG: hypothetical protein A2W18_10100 [Candidatus Muproteobacteria bacterium RBG_16_60_9]
MLTTKKIAGFAIATAAAGMFATAAVSTAFAASHAKDAGKIHCVGVNACKGKSECATASSSCKGQNACKGKGMNVMADKECEAKGGKVEKKG